MQPRRSSTTLPRLSRRRNKGTRSVRSSRFPQILRSGEDTTLQRVIQFLASRARWKAQDRTVQSIQREVVAVNTVAFRRARAAIAMPPKVVLPTRTDRTRPETLGQGMCVCGDVPKEPVGDRKSTRLGDRKSVA